MCEIQDWMVCEYGKEEKRESIRLEDQAASGTSTKFW